MKFFYVAIILLIILISIVTVNCIYINEVCRDLLSLIDEAIAVGITQADTQIEKIEQIWEDERATLSLSISYVELDKFDTHLSALKVAAESGNEYEYQSALKILKELAASLARLERLSISNILIIRKRSLPTASLF